MGAGSEDPAVINNVFNFLFCDPLQQCLSNLSGGVAVLKPLYDHLQGRALIEAPIVVGSTVEGVCCLLRGAVAHGAVEVHEPIVLPGVGGVEVGDRQCLCLVGLDLPIVLLIQGGVVEVGHGVVWCELNT